MNSPARQAKLQELIELIRSKMEEIKRANERDAIFEVVSLPYGSGRHWVEPKLITSIST